jgi:hypothetical protein
MSRLLVISLVACGGAIHIETFSPEADARRRAALVSEQCAVLTGLRHDTCVRLGPPRAPERGDWATASWWLYESRHWEMVPGSVEAVGPQVVCATHVTFAEDHVVESDEQCHRVKRYEP